MTPTRRRSLSTHPVAAFLKTIASTVLVVSVVVYSVAVWVKDWPPRDVHGLQGQWWMSLNLTRTPNFLLVVAHPDDECLFFSPTLLNLLNRRPPLDNGTIVDPPIGHLLSLSTGNADGLGSVRSNELRASCWALGIASDRCIAIDHPLSGKVFVHLGESTDDFISALPDSMSVWWPENDIIAIVNEYIKRWRIQTIITFDDSGISGHANHRAISVALTRAVHSDPQFPTTFQLLSTNRFLKYTSIISLAWSLMSHHHDQPISLSRIQIPIPQTTPTHTGTLTSSSSSVAPVPTSSSWLTSSTYLTSFTFSNTSHPLSTHRSFMLSNLNQFMQARRSFAQHQSQHVWFRKLWLVTSRYMWWNELERIVPIGTRLYDSKLRDEL